MKRAIAALVLSLSAYANADAQELIPFLEDRQLGVLISGTPLPPTLPKDLKSGLTNRILVRLVLDDTRTSRHKDVEVAIRYDLWDETFAVTTAVDAALVDTRTHRNLADVQAYLAKVRLPRLFAMSSIDPAREVTLRADVLFNPIDRERMEAIRKWVAQNSVQTPIDATVGPSLSDEIFKRIFEQYAAGSNVASVWRQNLSSKPFTLQALGNAQH